VVEPERSGERRCEVRDEQWMLVIEVIRVIIEIIRHGG
jgi:hypothetical protein